MARILPGQKKLEKAGFGTAPQERALMDVVGATPGGGEGQQDQSTPPQSATTTEQVFTPGSGGGSSSTQPTAPKQTKGSGYTNIQRILKASGTEGGPTRLAQAVTGGIQKQTTGAQSALVGATEEFQKGQTEEEERLKTQPVKTANILTTAATGGTITPEDVSVWQDITGGKYRGPSELSFSPTQMRQAAESAALSKLAGGAEGRAALLQKYVGAPQYGQSRQTLDALLLGKGGSSAIRSALRGGAKTEANINRQQAVAREQAKALERGFVGAAEEAKTRLSEAERGVLGDLETTKREQSEKLAGNIENFLNSFKYDPYNRNMQYVNIDQDYLSQLGLTTQDLNQLGNLAAFGIDPRNYLTGGSQEETLDYLRGLGVEQFATTEQIARLQALGQLAGEENLGLSNLGAIYKTPISAFDISSLTTDFNTKLNAMLGRQGDTSAFNIENVTDMSKYGDFFNTHANAISETMGGDGNKPQSEIVKDVENKINNNIDAYKKGKISASDVLLLDPIFAAARRWSDKARETRGAGDSYNRLYNIMQQRMKEIDYLIVGLPSVRFFGKSESVQQNDQPLTRKPAI